MTGPMNGIATKIAIVAVAQLALVGVAVAPQLSARAFGDEYRMRVAPVDPIDPFRGAYVDLGYPDLRLDQDDPIADDDEGTVFVTLVADGDLWKAGGYLRSRPDDGPYLTCDDRDWRIRCGIESWFVPQDEAAELQDAVGSGTMVAVIKVDGRGHAAIVGLEKG
jgi:uncharacterized membrane-anchored protein